MTKKEHQKILGTFYSFKNNPSPEKGIRAFLILITEKIYISKNTLCIKEMLDEIVDQAKRFRTKFKNEFERIIAEFGEVAEKILYARRCIRRERLVSAVR